MKRALITGITGQDGSYLAELLLSKGYAVHGLMRRGSSFTTGRIDHLLDGTTLYPGATIALHHGDLGDGTGLRRVLEAVQPCEVYNLAGQSHVRVSFDQPEYTADVVALGTLRLLEAVRDMRAPIRFYQASSSEQYGAAPPPQHEGTQYQPRSPYGVAKAAAHGFTTLYREAYGLHASCGILFNHESPRRGETFVTRKVTRAVGRIVAGTQRKLHLGNLKAERDWGWAPDYVEAMWRMLQQPEPGDYVVATGQSHSVGAWCIAAFREVGLQWDAYVEHAPQYERPAEVEHLLGDASKAQRRLGWQPTMTFPHIVRAMVEHDVALAKKEAARAA